MSLSNYAYYYALTGRIENVLWLDDDTAPELVWPAGYEVVKIPDGGVPGTWSMCGVGWAYTNGQFVEPPNPNPPVEPDSPIIP
jgi:hypothetical protein